jgi:hypothetical protein
LTEAGIGPGMHVLGVGSGAGDEAQATNSVVVGHFQFGAWSSL